MSSTDSKPTYDLTKVALDLPLHLNATYEHPGYIDISHNGKHFAFGDINGDVCYDVGDEDDPTERTFYEEDGTLPLTATNEQITEYIINIVEKRS